MNKFKNGLSIVIPVYNEIHGIDVSIKEVIRLITLMDFSAEVIIVNDGSTDGTKEIMTQLESKNSEITIIHHLHNQGYGAALKTGIKAAQYDYIAITDADNTYPNDRIPEFYNIILHNNYDMLVGARVGENVKIPLIRKPAKWMINKLANYLCEFKIPDLNSGLRIMRRSILEKYIKILPDGFSFTTTITLAMLTNGYSIRYEKIEYFKRNGSSKIRPIYDTLNFITLIIRTVLFFNPLKVFIPLSGLMFVTGIGLMLFRTLVNVSFGVTVTVIIIGALQMLAMGMLADLINRRMNE